MNVAVGVARSKHLAATDGTDMLVSRVGPDPVAQAQDRHHVDANAHCANSFENRSSPLDFENRWRWPVSYRSIEVLAVIIDILIILSAGVLADTIYRLATTGSAGETTEYLAAAAVVAALFTSLLKGRDFYKATVVLAWTSQVRAVTLTWIGVFMFLAGCVFALKIGGTFSRGTIMSFAAIGLSGLVAHRTFWRRALESGLASGKWSGRTIVLISENPPASDLQQQLLRHGFRINAILCSLQTIRIPRIGTISYRRPSPTRVARMSTRYLLRSSCRVGPRFKNRWSGSVCCHCPSTWL